MARSNTANTRKLTGSHLYLSSSVDINTMSRGVAARISVDGCNEISPLLSVKDFLETCRQSLSLESLECQPPEETANEMGVSEETVAQVRAICQYRSHRHETGVWENGLMSCVCSVKIGFCVLLCPNILKIGMS